MGILQPIVFIAWTNCESLFLNLIVPAKNQPAWYISLNEAAEKSNKLNRIHDQPEIGLFANLKNFFGND